MIDQMVKVHPEGVIWVTNSSEMLPVDSKNGSEGHKFKSNVTKLNRCSVDLTQRYSFSFISNYQNIYYKIMCIPMNTHIVPALLEQ